jgi:hypothetical protein
MMQAAVARRSASHLPAVDRARGLGSCGISLMDTSIVHKRRSLANIHITSNGGWGIVCSVPPAVAQIVGFHFQMVAAAGTVASQVLMLLQW